jgi:hypothetical protein
MKAMGRRFASVSSKCERIENGDVWHDSVASRAAAQLG